MTWLEPGHVSKKHGICTWRLRGWKIGKNGKRYKETLEIIKMPVIFSHFESYTHSMFDYHIFLCFGLDGFDTTYGIYVQVDKDDKPIWLPEYPKHIEYFVGGTNE